MITDLLERFPVDLSGSILIGDKPTDMEAARAAGIRGILFSGGNLAQLMQSVLYPNRNICN